MGVNISGELLITPLQESDHLAQRFGRLNRFGDQDDEPHRVGRAHVIPPGKKKDEERNKRFEATLNYVSEVLPKHADGSADISCRALYENPATDESRSKEPKIAILDQRLIQNWSQTTFRNDCVPDVDHWLQGQKEDDYPETELAWRAEVEYLVSDQVSQSDRKKALDTYRILPQETLKEPSRRLFEKLEKLPADERRQKVLVQWRWRDVEAETLDALIVEQRGNPGKFRDATILLRPGCGRLSAGIFHPTEGEAPGDVADMDAARHRLLATRTEGGWNIENPLSDAEPTFYYDWADAIEGVRVWKLQISEADEDEDVPERLLLFVTGVKSQKSKSKPLFLNDHLSDVQQQAGKFAAAVFPDLLTTYETAGQHHDEGKRSKLWQTAMGGSVETPFAKSNRPARPRLLEGYRHELGSVLHCIDKEHIGEDLTLHLIASHHGWARPYWDAKAYGPNSDPDHDGKEVLEAARRFSRLEEKFGAWGLAYLEALFKAADGIASGVAEGEATGD